MRKKGFMAIICFLFLFCITGPLYAREPRPARPKNLYPMVDGKSLAVYLDKIESEAPKVSPEEFREMLKNFLLNRGMEDFIISDSKENAEVAINVKILDYKYLEEDPVDQLSGGWSGLLVDAMVKQNYARVDAEFTVLKAKGSRRLWHRKFYSTVTESDMPEHESIPKVIEACCKQFVFLCFGKPKR